MTVKTDAIEVARTGCDITAQFEKLFRTGDGSLHDPDTAETVLARLQANYAALASESAATPALNSSIEECLDWSIPRVEPRKQSA